MPSRKHQVVNSSEWTLNLIEGPHCSIGYSSNEAMNSDGSTSLGRQNEDRYYTCIFQDSIELYMVLDGHDGTKAVKFAQTSIPHILLQSLLVGGPMNVMETIRSAILSTEREFFIGIDPHITRKVTLQLEIEQKVPDADSSIALKLFPTQVAEIGRLDDLIKGGTTVILALIHDSKLYVANVGDSRALLCSQAHDGSITVHQLSVDHNTLNEDELQRLKGCGLDPSKLRQAKRLGMQQNTRSIGDYSIKGGYQSVDIISHATSEPGTAEPYLSSPIDLSHFRGFLLLMSDGLYEAYEAWTRRPDHINEDIAHLVAQEMKTCPDIRVIAQNIVDKVKYLYRDTCKKGRRSGRLDDITLVVKNFGMSPLIRMQSTRSAHHISYSQVEPPSTAPVTTKQKFDFGVHGQYNSPHVQRTTDHYSGHQSNFPPQNPYVFPRPDLPPMQDVGGRSSPVFSRQLGQYEGPFYSNRGGGGGGGGGGHVVHHQASQFQGPPGGTYGGVAGVEKVTPIVGDHHRMDAPGGTYGGVAGVEKVTPISSYSSARYQPHNPSNMREELVPSTSDQTTPDPSGGADEVLHYTRHGSSSSISSTDTTTGGDKPNMPTITESENLSDKDLYGWSVEDDNNPSEHPTITSEGTLNPKDDDSLDVVDVGEKVDSGNSDFVYDPTSSPEEEEDEDILNGTASDGTICSYINFTKLFPADLSWSDIKIDP